MRTTKKTNALNELVAEQPQEKRYQVISTLLDKRANKLIALLDLIEERDNYQTSAPRGRLKKELDNLMFSAGEQPALLIQDLNKVLLFAVRFALDDNREPEELEGVLHTMHKTITFFENLYKEHVI